MKTIFSIIDMIGIGISALKNSNWSSAKMKRHFSIYIKMLQYWKKARNVYSIGRKMEFSFLYSHYFDF